MERIEEDLPWGAFPRFDVERGQEVVYVTADGRLGTWTCPYTGPKWFTAPFFKATRDQLQQLEAQVAQRVPKGTVCRVCVRTPPDADGAQELAVFAAVEASSHNLGD